MIDTEGKVFSTKEAVTTSDLSHEDVGEVTRKLHDLNGRDYDVF